MTRSELEKQLKSELISTAGSGEYSWLQLKKIMALFDSFLKEEVEQAKTGVVDRIAAEEGWQQNRDHMAVLFNLPIKYDHSPGKCVCAGEIYHVDPSAQQEKKDADN